MPRPVYSTQFLSARTVGGTPLDYVVPSGYRAVVVCVDVYNGSALAGAAVFIIDALTFTAIGEHLQWSGRQVFNAGQSVRMNSSSTDISVSVSGYLLID